MDREGTVRSSRRARLLLLIVLAGLGWWLGTHLQQTPFDTPSARAVAGLREMAAEGGSMPALAGRVGFLQSAIATLVLGGYRQLDLTCDPVALLSAISVAAALAAMALLAIALRRLGARPATHLPVLVALAATGAMTAAGTAPGPIAVHLLLLVLGAGACHAAAERRRSVAGELSGLLVFLLCLEGPLALLLLPAWLFSLAIRARRHGLGSITGPLLLLAAPLLLLAALDSGAFALWGHLQFAGWGELGSRLPGAIPAPWWPLLVLSPLLAFRYLAAVLFTCSLASGIALWACVAPHWPGAGAVLPLFPCAILIALTLEWITRSRAGWVLGPLWCGLSVLLSWPAVHELGRALHERRHALADIALWLVEQRRESDVFLALNTDEEAFLQAYGWPRSEILQHAAEGISDLEAIERAARGSGVSSRRLLLLLGPGTAELRGALIQNHRLRLLHDVDPGAVRQIFDRDGRSLDPGWVTRSAPMRVYQLELLGGR